MCELVLIYVLYDVSLNVATCDLVVEVRPTVLFLELLLLISDGIIIILMTKTYKYI